MTGVQTCALPISDRQAWTNAVQAQALPWISVCDFRGLDGIAPRIYNIDRVPANYLIDASGEIVGRNIPADRLAEQVERLVGKKR